MKKRYAFLLMGGHYDPAAHRCGFETDRDTVEFRTVRDLEEAKAVAVELQGRGFGAIEVCGAFGEDGARQLAEATGEKVAIGYVTHDSRLDGLFAAFFG